MGNYVECCDRGKDWLNELTPIRNREKAYEIDMSEIGCLD